MIVRTNGSGYPDATKIVVKPNWTQTLLIDGKIDPDVLGTHTDLHFIDGFLHGMREAGPQHFSVRECFRPSHWENIGYRAWAEKNGYDLQDLSSKPIWEQDEGNINFVKVPDGVVFREVGFMAPVNEPGTFLLNIAKLKSHGMGITASVKNLQGTCAHTFHTFCTFYDRVRASCGPRYHVFFHDDFEKHIEQLHKKHAAQGISRWDRPGPDGGIWQEQWVNRILDTLSVTSCFEN